MRDIMTPEQVADYLQLNTDTVYRLIRGKRLAASRIGRTYRISREDVEAFLLEHSTRPRVREALIKRVAEIGERNAARYPGLTSDQVLEELEAQDAARRHPKATSQATRGVIRAVIDLNVIISAMISPLGIPYRIWSAWLSAGRFTSLISEGMILELTGKLATPRIARR
jgi:excisionase family DNA binding protein